jgi:hypothetical protein
MKGLKQVSNNLGFRFLSNLYINWTRQVPNSEKSPAKERRKKKRKKLKKMLLIMETVFRDSARTHLD